MGKSLGGIASLLGEGKPKETGCGRCLKGGAGGWGERVGAWSGEGDRLQVQQPRVPRGSHPPTASSKAVMKSSSS